MYLRSLWFYNKLLDRNSLIFKIEENVIIRISLPKKFYLLKTTIVSSIKIPQYNEYKAVSTKILLACTYLYSWSKQSFSHKTEKVIKNYTSLNYWTSLEWMRVDKKMQKNLTQVFQDSNFDLPLGFRNSFPLGNYYFV